MTEHDDKNRKTLKQRWNKVTGSESNNNEFDGLDGQLPGFPGYLLRQAREEKALSQMKIARELHLTSRVLDGLETDDFTHVNSPIFARGYIRSYSRYLGLDPDLMVAEYDAVYGSPDHSKKPMSVVRHVDEQARPGDTWVKLVSVVIVLALLGASWWWWQGQQDTVAPTSVGEVTVQDSQGEDVSASLPEDEVLDLQLGDLSNDIGAVGATDETPAVPVVSEPVVEAQPEAEPKPAAEPEALVPTAPVEEVAAVAATKVAAANSAIDVAPGQGLLVIEFVDDCWVEIQDGNGVMVLADLKSSGQVINMAIQAPAQVLLGRASAVSNIDFAQRDIDLEPHTRKDIARVTLEL
jgi:cytoskeleton protein RodZ